MTRKTPNYREMLRLKSEGFSQQQIADSVGSSKKTVNRVLKLAAERQIAWPLTPEQTNVELARLLGSPPRKTQTDKRMPDFDLVHKQLLRNGVNKKLLWTEYVENCRLSGEQWLMYSQFCYYVQHRGGLGRRSGILHRSGHRRARRCLRLCGRAGLQPVHFRQGLPR